jgi:hypothetical protein
MATQEIAEKATDGTVAEKKPHELFVDYLGRRAEADAAGNDAFDITSKQIDKIFDAETEDDIWDADEGGTIACQDYIGNLVRINSYRVMRSTNDEYDAALGVWVLIDCVNLETGDPVILNTQSPMIIAKLRAFETKNLLPINAKIDGTKTQNGNTVLRLKRAPKLLAQPVQATAE